MVAGAVESGVMCLLHARPLLAGEPAKRRNWHIKPLKRSADHHLQASQRIGDLLNIDTGSTTEIASALEVIDGILAGLAPVLEESQMVVNADHTLTVIGRSAVHGQGFEVVRTRYRFDENSQDVWVWEDD